MKKIKIAYFTIVDPLDKRSWSGIPFYLARALQENGFELDFLGPVKIPSLLDKFYRAGSKLNRTFFRSEYFVKHSMFWGWYASGILKKRMKGKKYDFVFAPAATAELAFLKTDLPVVYSGDSTFNLMSNFYLHDYKNISKFSRWEGNYLEKKALEKSDHVIYSSQWAADSAIKDYNYKKENIFISPLCANMDFVPSKNMIFNKLETKTLTLLWLAVEWERKGGNIAYETLLHLINDYKIDAKLIVCGCVPPKEFSHPKMQVIPFLNKNIHEDHEKFVSLLSTSHFLILPTRADCGLIVGCEANAYGMPVITTDTGGVSNVIKDDVNGYCLPLSATSDAYAKKIADLYSDNNKYVEMIGSSRKRFEEVLNWNVWAKHLIQLYNDRFAKSGIKNVEKTEGAKTEKAH